MSNLGVTRILSPLSLVAFALAAFEAQHQEKRQVLSVVDSIASDATSDAGSVITRVTSLGGTVASGVTSLGGNIATQVTSINGEVYTEITSIGGSEITLAGSGVGRITTFAGSVYTVATSAVATSSGNAALANDRLFHVSVPLLSALAATVGGVMLGAWAAL
ncbi:hypothetical protein V8E53_012186 [Lactarius tabidus]